MGIIEGMTIKERWYLKRECGLKRKICLGQNSEEKQYPMFRDEVKGQR